MRWKGFINGLHQQESGQDMLEYALVAAAVLLVVVAGSEQIATFISNGVTKVNGKITSIVK